MRALIIVVMAAVLAAGCASTKDEPAASVLESAAVKDYWTDTKYVESDRSNPTPLVGEVFFTPKFGCKTKEVFVGTINTFEELGPQALIEVGNQLLELGECHRTGHPSLVVEVGENLGVKDGWNGDEVIFWLVRMADVDNNLWWTGYGKPVVGQGI